MLHWVESRDRRGFECWLRCASYSHWGLIVTAELPRWVEPIVYDSGRACLFLPPRSVA